MIDQARRGDAVALGLLLESHRDQLRMTARGMIGPSLRTRVDASDIVQEAFLRAHRQFPSFQGSDGPELGTWLRTILIHCLVDQIKHHHRLARDHRRQQSLDAILRRAGRAEGAILARDPSPSEAAARDERAALLAQAVDLLPPDQRAVYLLRAREHLPFEQIGPRLSRSVGAAHALGPGD